MTVAEKGVVYLVGAGPGDPELLTVRALRLLESADVVLHDDLVPAEVLALVHRHALVTSVGKRCGRPRITQAGIHALMIESARAGQSVVRLKSGDPLVFGRAGEEIAALRAAGVRFEVVPGVTAAFAAGAALGLPLTDRKSASKLIFCYGASCGWEGCCADVEWGAAGGCDAGGVYAGAGSWADCAGAARGGGWRRMWRAARSRMRRRRGRAGWRRRVDGLEGMECGPAPVLLLVGRAMASLLAGEDDGVVREVVEEASEGWACRSSAVEDGRERSR